MARIHYAIKKRIPQPVKRVLRWLVRKTSSDSLQSTLFNPEILPRSLDGHFHSVLTSLYRFEPQIGSDGQFHELRGSSMTDPVNGAWLYEFCRKLKPETSLEIGMAYGLSTMFIMAAMHDNGIGRHTSIDPFQFSSFKGIGVVLGQQAEKLGVGFNFINDRSDRACVDLARLHQEFDLIFVDGGHRFDDVLVDFYLCAPLIKLGGYLIFDDCWMDSIRSVVSFIRTNRQDFKEILDGPSTWCVFRRIGDDQRDWRHFKAFTVAKG